MAAEILQALDTAALITLAEASRQADLRNSETLVTILEHISATKTAVREAQEAGKLPPTSRRAQEITALSMEEEESPSRKIARRLLEPYRAATDPKVKELVVATEGELIGQMAHAVEAYGVNITEASEATGLTESQLRYFGKLGFEQYANTKGTQRRYTMFDIAALTVIQTMMDHDMSPREAVEHVQPIRNRAANPSTQG